MSKQNNKGETMKADTRAKVQGDFLNAVLNELSLKNDAAMSRKFGLQPPTISKIRSGKLPVGAQFRIDIHEATGWTFPKMRKMLGEQEKAAQS